MIRAARGDLTQMELASRLGVGQPAVSGWEAGKVDLTAEMLWSLESSLDRPHGWFSVAGGFTDPTLEPFLALLEASTAAVRFLSQGEVEAIRATCTNSVDDAS